MTVLRSLLFNILFFGWTAVVCLAIAWTLLFPRSWLMTAIRFYLRSVHWLERTVLDLDYEVRGRENLPEGCYLAAAKHQSAWETMKLHALFGDPAVVLKRELLYLPVWGWLAWKSDQIPVNRGGRSKAIASLIEGARRMKALGRPIVIFPQGTRTAPGSWRPYRIGIGVLYRELDLPIVPVALNSGLYWPRRSFHKRPGTVVIEILPPIRPGLSIEEAMAELETRLEAATDRLVTAAGGPATVRPAPAAAA